MKYIITDKNEVRIGYGFHAELASNCLGKVIGAGHCTQDENGYTVFGESIGYGIKSKAEDAEILNKSMPIK